MANKVQVYFESTQTWTHASLRIFLKYDFIEFLFSQLKQIHPSLQIGSLIYWRAVNCLYCLVLARRSLVAVQNLINETINHNVSINSKSVNDF